MNRLDKKHTTHSQYNYGVDSRCSYSCNLFQKPENAHFAEVIEYHSILITFQWLFTTSRWILIVDIFWRMNGME